jgi:hypothetical protein
MNVFNKIFLVLSAVLSFTLFGVAIITLLRGNLVCSLLGLLFAVMMALIVKHWENK